MQGRAGMLILVLGLLSITLPPTALSQGLESEAGAVQFSFEQRVRTENWNNLFDYNGSVNDERQQIRIRSRAWVTAPIGSSIEFGFGINSESNERRGSPREVGEIIFERAYLDFKRLPIKGLSLRIGRQDLTRGDGFIFSDSTPYDGSRSFYANAIVLAWTRSRHTLEAIALSDPARDRYFPTFHSQSRMLQEADERAAGLYYSGRALAHADIDAYYLLKKEDHCIVARTDPRHRPDRHVHAAGSRLVKRFAAWTVNAEGALQWGRQAGGIPIRGWGATTQVRRVLWKARNLDAATGYEQLSGDNPSTPGRVEGWNPMFARFVKPSELYLYSGMHENGLGYWSNLGAFTTEAGMNVTRSMRLRGAWNRFTAPQRFAGNPAIFAGGGLRGNNLQVRLDFCFGSSWRAHIQLERMLPGNFYQHRSPAYFLRFETSFIVNKSLHPKEMFRK